MIYDVLYLLRALCVCHESVTLHIIVSMAFFFKLYTYASEVGTDGTVHINQYILYYCFHILISKYNSNDLC